MHFFLFLVIICISLQMHILKQFSQFLSMFAFGIMHPVFRAAPSRNVGLCLLGRADLAEHYLQCARSCPRPC